MHKGMQCSSCSLRYLPEQESHHHHQNCQSEKIPYSFEINIRKYYLHRNDWIQDSEKGLNNVVKMNGFT